MAIFCTAALAALIILNRIRAVRCSFLYHSRLQRTSNTGHHSGLVGRALPHVSKEIVIVDDNSKDGTCEWLKANFPHGERSGSTVDLDTNGNLVFNQAPGPSTVNMRPIYHEQNRGKGGGLQTGFAAVSGDVLIIQDADVEYDPNDWEQMYDLIAVRKVADVVFGSRFYGRPHRSLFFHHYMANRLISFVFNLIFNQTLTDIESATR